MRISYNWLKQYINFTQTPQEIGALLTGSGLEVEGIETHELVQGGLQGIVIGEVLTCGQHPDADRLRITTVDIGDGESRQIVCGAPNVAAGQKVVVATEGATLYPSGGEPFKIKKSKIRGQASEGMICAEDEIGLGASHAGIMVLDTDLPNGTPAAQYFQLESDSVIEIGLTPNRADAASHLGVARDLKALLSLPVQLPDLTGFREGDEQPLPVEVQNTDACPRYAGITVRNVKVGESPDWLQQRLRSIGLSPINNVVDVTNFVLHELGQPLHAFDAAQLAGSQIVVRNARDGEELTTLDGLTRKLKADDQIIADAEKALALAGVLGGQGSGVTTQTNTVFLESAYFNPAVIRKTAQRLGIKTDASFRFERGTDPEMVLTALKRAALLLVEVAGGEIATTVQDIYPSPVHPAVIEISIPRIQRLLGEAVPTDTITGILNNLDIKTESTEADTLKVTVPAYRVDVTREADIAEEVLRIYGFDRIKLPAYLGSQFLAPFPKPDPELIKETVANMLSANGFVEIFTNSLTNSKYYEALPEFTTEELVPILNYNTEELNAMRATPVFSGLEVVRHNVNRRQRDLKLFEFGTTYHTKGEGYREQNYLALYLTGDVHSESWQQPSKAIGYSELAAALQMVFGKLGVTARVTPQPLTSDSTFASGLEYRLDGKSFAKAGILQPALTRHLDVKEVVFYAELDWETATRKQQTKLTAEEPSKFPEVRRDLSLVLNKGVTFAQIKALAEKTERKLLRQVHVFDVYQGDKIGQNQKAYSVSFLLQDPQQTLTDNVIDSTMQKLMQRFEQELGAVIRK